MKRYVIQSRIHSWDHWEVIPGREYDTLVEARTALAAMPVKTGCRIAEAYVQVRYKAVNIGAPEPPYRLPTPPTPRQKGDDR